MIKDQTTYVHMGTDQGPGTEQGPTYMLKSS